MSRLPVSHLGRHLLAEFYDCDPNILNNLSLIDSAMTEAAISCGATIVQKNFHHFQPYGISGVVIISESHLAIHTWPEYGYAAVDLFTCGESCNPEIAYHALKTMLNSRHAFYTELSRGSIDPETNEMLKKPFSVKLLKMTPEAQPTYVPAHVEVGEI